MSLFGSLFGGGGGDGGAKEARRAEEERQRKIQEGTNRVNALFGGPISEEYADQEAYQVPDLAPHAPVAGRGTVMAPDSFNQFGDRPVQTVTKYRPVTKTRTSEAPGQFTDQYFSNIGQAFRDYFLPQVDQQFQDAMRKIKVSTPTMQSSSFARRSGQLTQDYERSKADVGDRSLSAEGDARSNVENSRNSILAAVRAGAGAEDAAASATNAIKSLRAPPVYSPIGDLFARYLNTTANATIADNAGYQRTPLSLNTLFPSRGKALSTVN